MWFTFGFGLFGLWLMRFLFSNKSTIFSTTLLSSEFGEIDASLRLFFLSTDCYTDAAMGTKSVPEARLLLAAELITYDLICPWLLRLPEKTALSCLSCDFLDDMEELRFIY